MSAATPPGPATPARSWAERLGATSRLARVSLAVAGVAIIAAVVISATTGGSTGAARGPAAAPVAAKNFTLQAVGHPGAKVSLAGYAGKPVIVNFFASWCQPCQRETPLLASFYRQAGGRVVIIGVDSNDSAVKAQQFLHQAGVTYPVGADPYPAAATTSYGVYGLPQTFFLNAQHRIVSHIAGPLTMKDLTAGVALMDGKHSSGLSVTALG